MGLNVKSVATCLERVCTTKNGAKWAREVAEGGTTRTYTNVVTGKTIKFGDVTERKFIQFGNRRIGEPGYSRYSICGGGNYTTDYSVSGSGTRIFKGTRPNYKPAGEYGSYIHENIFCLDPSGKRITEFTTRSNGNQKCALLGSSGVFAQPSHIYEDVGGVHRVLQGPDEAPLWTGLQDALINPTFKLF